MRTVLRSIIMMLAIGTLFSLQASAIEVLPSLPTIPNDNPMTDAKINLGKKLFFDPRLSKNSKVSCNSCHNVMASGADPDQFSSGVGGKKGGRNSPTVWNAAFMSVQFWDGRAASLEEQAKGPLVNPVEMAMENLDVVVKRVYAIPGYRKEFADVFGGGEKSLTIDNLAKAIAAYERTLLTPNSPVDKFLKGDAKALSASAKHGMELVQSVGCTTCHMGPNYAGPPLAMGTGFYQKFPAVPGSEYEKKYNLIADLGRYGVTKNDADKNMWRVPTWRNVALTAPYFHNGSVKTLDEAVRVMAKTQLGKTLSKPDVRDIVAFLTALNGERPKQTKPVLPPDSPNM